MIQRTVSGAIAGSEQAFRQVPRWEARDEWGTRLVLSGDGDDPDTIEKYFAAVDATAAAELAVEHLVERGLVNEATTVEVRCVTVNNGQWQAVRVNVWISYEFEVSARGLAPKAGRRRA